MIPDYDPRNWYWLLNGRIWSSADRAYVENCDQFIAAGGSPTPIAYESDLRGLLAMQAPEIVGIMTPDQFFDLFTFDEWAGIKATAATSPQIEYLLDRLRVCSAVDPSSETVKIGLHFLRDAGLIPPQKAADILAMGDIF